MRAARRLRVLLAAAGLAAMHIFAAAQTLESVVMPGMVIQGHAKYETDCRKCHTPFNRAAQTRLCLDCHKETAADVRAAQGYHGRIRERERECRLCHTDHKGRAAKIVVLDERKFDHGQSDYPLKAAHVKVECRSCHVAGKKYRDAPQSCNDCHRTDDKHKGALGPKCKDCHTEVNWKVPQFDHERTRFPLREKHVDVKCRDCHADERYRGDPRQCNGCHRKDDFAKGHHGRYGEKCQSCHNERVWKPSIFNHDKDTKYLLRGKHVATKCDSCHEGKNIYRENLSSKCIDCHRKDDFAKGHHGRYGEKCQSCHDERAWKPASTFNHDKDTKYLLRGKHVTTKCDSCHKGKNIYRENLSSKCIDCHRKDDVHKGGLSAKCESCHNERTWKTSQFDHDRDSDYPLRDKHRTARCESCHQDKVFKEKLPKTCIGCHRKDDDAKGHRGRYGEKCQSCHDERAWEPASTFNHDKDTKYLLRGKHVTTKCDDCHKGDLYRDKLQTTCNDCHQRDDKHEGQLGRRCESCHAESDWKRTTFDHNGSRYPLLGRHARVECKDCHTTLRYRDAKTECLACHTKDDKHKLRLGPRCEPCHNARSWKAWDFDHNKTHYRLDGAHVRTDCYACHRDPVKDKIRLDLSCMSCHARDDVHHGQFGGQCERCHTTANFRDIKIPKLRGDPEPPPPASDDGSPWWRRLLPGVPEPRPSRP